MDHPTYQTAVIMGNANTPPKGTPHLRALVDIKSNLHHQDSNNTSIILPKSYFAIHPWNLCWLFPYFFHPDILSLGIFASSFAQIMEIQMPPPRNKALITRPYQPTMGELHDPVKPRGCSLKLRSPKWKRSAFDKLAAWVWSILVWGACKKRQ